MNSWDVFDTLLTRRVLEPRAVPCPRADQLFPIRENVLRVQPGDVLISDMAEMTPEAVTALVREVTGLENRVIVTPDGKRSGAVWKKLKREVVIERHTGDNTEADFAQPMNHGIPAQLFRCAGLTAAEWQLDDQGFHRLALVCREARLRTFHAEHRAIELAQVDINFPMLYLAAQLLKPYLEGRRVLAAARDCWLFQHLLRDVAGVDAVYWYSSRLARAFPSADYLNYTASLMDDNTVLFDLVGTGWSLRRLAMELSAQSKIECWMLAYCGGQLEQDYESLMATKGQVRWLVASASQGLEHNNLAPHPMVVDVGPAAAPKYWNPTEFDWAGSPEIRAQHEAFHLAHRILGNYPEDLGGEPGVKPAMLARLVEQLPEFEFFPREDPYVQDELKRMADCDHPA